MISSELTSERYIEEIDSLEVVDQEHGLELTGTLSDLIEAGRWTIAHLCQTVKKYQKHLPTLMGFLEEDISKQQIEQCILTHAETTDGIHYTLRFRTILDHARILIMQCIVR